MVTCHVCNVYCLGGSSGYTVVCIVEIPVVIHVVGDSDW